MRLIPNGRGAPRGLTKVEDDDQFGLRKKHDSVWRRWKSRGHRQGSVSNRKQKPVRNMILWLHGNDKILGRKLTEDEEHHGSLGLRRRQELERRWPLTVWSKNERRRLDSSLYRARTPQFGWKSRVVRVRFGGDHARLRLGYDARKKERLTSGSYPSATLERGARGRGCSLGRPTLAREEKGKRLG
jgi:hypothetical protein